MYIYIIAFASSQATSALSLSIRVIWFNIRLILHVNKITRLNIVPFWYFLNHISGYFQNWSNLRILHSRDPKQNIDQIIPHHRLTFYYTYYIELPPFPYNFCFGSKVLQKPDTQTVVEKKKYNQKKKNLQILTRDFTPNKTLCQLLKHLEGYSTHNCVLTHSLTHFISEQNFYYHIY